MLKRLIYAAVGVVGLALIGLAIASATVWRADDVLRASAQADAPIVLTDPGVLEMAGDPVTVTASVPDGGRVVLAVGRDTDVDGWVGTDSYQRVAGLASWQTLELATGEAIGEALAPDDAQAAADEAGADGDTAAAEDEPAATTPPPDPTTSDMWVAQAQGDGSATLTWQTTPGRWSLLVVGTDAAGAAAPPALELAWPRTVTTPYLVPGTVAGGLLLVLALGLLWRELLRARHGADEWTPVLTEQIPAVATATGDQPVLTRRQLREMQALGRTGQLPVVHAGAADPGVGDAPGTTTNGAAGDAAAGAAKVGLGTAEVPVVAGSGTRGAHGARGGATAHGVHGAPDGVAAHDEVAAHAGARSHTGAGSRDDVGSRAAAEDRGLAATHRRAGAHRAAPVHDEVDGAAAAHREAERPGGTGTHGAAEAPVGVTGGPAEATSLESAAPVGAAPVVGVPAAVGRRALRTRAARPTWASTTPATGDSPATGATPAVAVGTPAAGPAETVEATRPTTRAAAGSPPATPASRPGVTSWQPAAASSPSALGSPAPASTSSEPTTAPSPETPAEPGAVSERAARSSTRPAWAPFRRGRRTGEPASPDTGATPAVTVGTPAAEPGHDASNGVTTPAVSVWPALGTPGDDAPQRWRSPAAASAGIAAAWPSRRPAAGGSPPGVAPSSSARPSVTGASAPPATENGSQPSWLNRGGSTGADHGDAVDGSSADQPAVDASRADAWRRAWGLPPLDVEEDQR